ncbi:cytochrome P450, partial [Saccharata proteae CBS 121410]
FPSQLLRRNHGSLFGFTRSHQIFDNPEKSDRLLGLPHSTLDNEPTGWAFHIRVFGVKETPGLRERHRRATKGLQSAVDRGFLHEGSVSEKMSRADIPGKAASLISFASKPEDLRIWERSCNPRLVPARKAGENHGAEVSLFRLMRDFGAHIAMMSLYGVDFCYRHKELLEDFWKFDNDCFPLLVIGMPQWLPIKPLKEGLAARARMRDALTEYYERLEQYQNGTYKGSADLNDVSSTALDRLAAYQANGIPPESRGELDMALLWAQSANTQPLVFWFTAYVYSTPGLLSALREELAPYVSLSSDELPIITDVQHAGLSKDCPLFKSAYFETFRLANEATSVRHVNKPLSVQDDDRTHQLKPGTWLSIPHAISQYDPSMYPEPHKYIPDRFIEVDEGTGKRVARYGALRPWGIGLGMCKGRTFAEKEVLIVVASVIMLWDFEPASGPWKVPKAAPGTGVMIPTEDLRVVGRRRRRTTHVA